MTATSFAERRGIQGMDALLGGQVALVAGRTLLTGLAANLRVIRAGKASGKQK
jgi:hypothetical protein